MKTLLTVFGIFLANLCLAQEKLSDGPIIKGYGEVWTVANPGLSPMGKHKVVFDVYYRSGDASAVNSGINSIGRFLNMHAQSGVPLDSMDLIAVVHGDALVDVMNNQYYKKKFKVDNPNSDLIKQLKEVGVKIYVCGQSMQISKYPVDKLEDGVEVSLSAMTAISLFCGQGYTKIW